MPTWPYSGLPKSPRHKTFEVVCFDDRMQTEIDHIIRMWRFKGRAPEQEADMRAMLAEVLADLPDNDPHGLFVVGMTHLYRTIGKDGRLA
jgi:hypothetical protein